MQPHAPKRSQLTFDLVDGAILVVLLLWTVTSFAPLVTVTYGDPTAVESLVNLGFLATGPLAIGAVLLVVHFAATPATRRRLWQASRRRYRQLGLFATAWLLAYSAAT